MDSEFQTYMIYLSLRLCQERDDGFRRAQPAHAKNLQPQR